MKERPILFSGPMVRAILEGRKTQTRRVVKVQPPGHMKPMRAEWFIQARVDKNGDVRDGPEVFGVFDDEGEWGAACPYGVIGGRLWVRETFTARVSGCPEGLAYRADHVNQRGDGPAHPMTWTPSIHMPRWASRLTLAITDVRVQRLNDISENDAKAEGVPRHDCSVRIGDTHRAEFACLWNTIHGPNAWEANPWVWALTFDVVKGDAP